MDPKGLASNYTVSLSDGTLTVTAAVLLSGTPQTVVANQGPVLLDSAARVADGAGLNYGGGTLSVEVVTNASAADWLGVQAPGANSGKLGLDGSTVTWAGAGLASFAGGSGTNALVFSLTTNATAASLTALLEQVAFASGDTNGGIKVVAATLAYGKVEVSAHRVMSLDRPPVVNEVDIWATAAATITIPKSQLLTGAMSPAGNPLSLSAVTAADGTVVDAGTNVLYKSNQSPAITNLEDTLSFTVEDNQGGQTVGLAHLHLLIKGEMFLDASGLQETGTQVVLAATPGQVYQMQVSSDLVHWTVLGTAAANATGVVEVLDPLARTSPYRFYRALLQ